MDLSPQNPRMDLWTLTATFGRGFSSDVSDVTTAAFVHRSIVSASSSRFQILSVCAAYLRRARRGARVVAVGV